MTDNTPGKTFTSNEQLTDAKLAELVAKAIIHESRVSITPPSDLSNITSVEALVGYLLNGGAKLVDCIKNTGTGTRKLETLNVAAWADGSYAVASGYSAALDGGGGLFQLDKSGALGAGAANGVTIFAATGGTNWYWRRMAEPVWRPEFSGCVGDGVADDTAALKKVCENGGKVLLTKAKKYRITEPLRINKPTDFDLGGAEIIYDGTGGWPNNYAIQVQPDVGDHFVQYWGDFRVSDKQTALVQGERVFTFDDVSGLSVGDNVAVTWGWDEFDAHQPHGVYFTQVEAISGNSVTLSMGLPEPCAIQTIAYSVASLAGGNFSEGDIITQGGVSAVVTNVQTESYPGINYHRMSLKNITGGNFVAGTITNGTASATLVSQQKATTVSNISRVGLLAANSWPHGTCIYGGRISYTNKPGTMLLHAVQVDYATNVTIHDIEAPVTTGSTFQITYCQHFRAWNLHNYKAVNGSGPITSAIIGMYSVRQAEITNYSARVEHVGVWIESQCRNVVLNNGLLQKISTEQYNGIITVTRGCKGILFDGLEVVQNSPSPLGLLRLFDVDGRSAPHMDIVVRRLTIPYHIGLDFDFIEGPITVIDGQDRKLYSRKVQQLLHLNLVPGQEKVLELPSGLYKQVKLFFPANSAYISALYLSGTTGSENGQGDNISALVPTDDSVVFSPNLSSLSPANRGIGPKVLAITSTDALPLSVAWVKCFVEYWEPDSYGTLAGEALVNSPLQFGLISEPNPRIFSGHPFGYAKHIAEIVRDNAGNNTQFFVADRFEPSYLGWEPLTDPRRKTTLGWAMVRALNSTPVELVAAPGAGLAVRVKHIWFFLDFNSLAYTGANNIEFRYTNGGGNKVAQDIHVSSLNAASDQIGKLFGLALDKADLTADAPVVATVPVANPAAGNSPLVLFVTYEIVAV